MAADIVLTGSFLEASAGIVAQISAVIQATGEEIRQGSADRAPVDTGYLRDHITFEMTGPLSGEVVAEADYSAYVEFGTSRAPAQPFLTPAVDAARQGFEDGLRVAVGG